ncbi:hypothetical protein GCM10011506_15300 [Marivirga lumbricoides]|uniref:Uncharacterized protein n=1 Tax=Marivirga lumbricoides TaxID=1046115 RepID=A0ABQ1LWS0_9BACT|nr:hypothetical protein GCM10011506_15300 [Marivirga lumbricoides]
MEKLDDNWITKGTLDFEYKKYILLAYLQHVEQSFEQKKLYPSLADLINHYRNASSLKDGKTKLFHSFPKRLSRVDLESFELLFETVIKDDAGSQQLEEILNFSLAEMKSKLHIGQNIFDAVEKQLFIEPVGVKALEDNEGLLMIDPEYDKYYHVYKYKVSIFETAHEKMRGLQTDFIASIRKSIGTTLEQLKVKIISNMKLVSNYSTYRVISLEAYPYNETLLPIVKRRFSSFLAESA